MCRDCQSRYLATAQPRRSERRFVLTADSLPGTVKEFSRTAASTNRTVGTRDRKAGSRCRTAPNADGMAGNTRRTAGLPRHGSAATCPTAGSIGQAQKPRHRTGKSFYLTAELFYHAVFRQKHADIAKTALFHHLGAPTGQKAAFWDWSARQSRQRLEVRTHKLSTLNQPPSTN